MGDKDDGIGTTTANVLGTTTASRSFVRHMFRRPRSHICPPFIGPTSERSSDQSTKLFVVLPLLSSSFTVIEVNQK